jgi:uroporphyrinogen III methyltransferase/synthase
VTGVAERGRGPLAGARVLVTREERGEGELRAEIESLGGEAVRFPLLETRPPEDAAPLAAAVRSLAEYDWIAFTSARGAIALHAACEEAGAAPSPSTRLAAVGEATARAVRERFGRVELVSEVMTGEGLARALEKASPLAGRRILLPRADIATPGLPRMLREAGAAVEEIVAYRTVTTDVDAAPVRSALLAGEIDAVTFASGSAAHAFAEVVGAELLRAPSPRARVVSIGPVTSEALRALDIMVDEEATSPGMRELAGAVVRALGRGGSES